MISFIFKCAVIYVLIFFVLIPLCVLVYSLFFAVGGIIARIYYKIEDYLTKETIEQNKDESTKIKNKKHKK